MYRICLLGGDCVWFWWFMLCCNVLISVAMILGGWFMWKHCPKKINPVSGYRSARSQKNLDTWKFANENCGKRWWTIGWIMLFPTIIVQIHFYGKSDTMALLCMKMGGKCALPPHSEGEMTLWKPPLRRKNGYSAAYSPAAS